MAAERTVSDLQGKTAGVATRTMAGAVDYAFIWSIVGLSYLGLAILGFLINPRRFTWPDVPIGWFLLAGFVLMFFYLWLSWATRGKTFGSMVLGTRVVSLDGDRLDFIRAGLRAGFVTVFPIGLFTCAITPGSRSIHDIPLATKVIYHYKVDQLSDDPNPVQERE
ncbi:MAG TPA: RDD family protein [Aeromicrobium sp.]|nr:RDD family protein [Aeromicrobium sp.]